MSKAKTYRISAKNVDRAVANLARAQHTIERARAAHPVEDDSHDILDSHGEHWTARFGRDKRDPRRYNF